MGVGQEREKKWSGRASMREREREGVGVGQERGGEIWAREGEVRVGREREGGESGARERDGATE